MARREIIADDLTDVEIDGDAVTASVTLSILRKGADPISLAVDWDLSNYSAESFYALIETGDLAGFIADMRPMIKMAGTDNATDSEVIRKWFREAHPDEKIGDKGRIPAEIRARYRREVTTRTEAGDSK